MKIYLIIYLMLLFSSQPLIAGEYAKEANDNPFINGELNLKYEGELTALAGEVLEIKPTKQKFHVYKINLRVEGIKHIWVNSIVPPPGGAIEIGDMVIFKGYISSSSELDATGELETLINSKSLLLALKAERPK